MKMKERSSANKTLLYFTVPTVILMAITSSIGIWYPDFYARETIDWVAQSIGQDISNLFIVVPVLIISAIFSSKGSRTAKLIWAGTMTTNIYAYVIYTFAVHFNFLFHVYCLILGLSLYSVICFFMNHVKENFSKWFTEKAPTRAVGIFLLVIAVLFVLLWLSQSLPAALSNTVPESIVKDGLLTNPVHALDLSFYLPLMGIAAVMILKKKTLGFLLAPVMIVFSIMTGLNILSLMIVSMTLMPSNNLPMIIGFSALTLICLGFLWLFLRRIRGAESADRCM
ncbi:hypothetical protein [Sporolactobacillus putidus]|uniref:Uncharacterized protein n=1 Tax=Sporolactobacillus putidus TaxID=492735 RepID=A0A917W2Q0_9BACL|nr:hypothetical protein [Sporolactobacillus putidus]GGL61149.1 hypothetical protein GCM10007968_26420 [Sporolactobacillus putidus]